MPIPVEKNGHLDPSHLSIKQKQKQPKHNFPKQPSKAQNKTKQSTKQPTKKNKTKRTMPKT
jgi:hypothetical protein